jgi:hypothetical protein
MDFIEQRRRSRPEERTFGGQKSCWGTILENACEQDRDLKLPLRF